MVNLSRKREIRTIVETYLALTQKSSFFPPQTGSGMFHCIPRKRFQQGRKAHLKGLQLDSATPSKRSWLNRAMNG